MYQCATERTSLFGIGYICSANGSEVFIHTSNTERMGTIGENRKRMTMCFITNRAFAGVCVCQGVHLQDMNGKFEGWEE